MALRQPEDTRVMKYEAMLEYARSYSVEDLKIMKTETKNYLQGTYMTIDRKNEQEAFIRAFKQVIDEKQNIKTESKQTRRTT